MTTPPDLPDNAALFLDFDGTLIEFADTPDGVTVPETLVPLLAQTAGPVRRCTGRSVWPHTG